MSKHTEYIYKGETCLAGPLTPNQRKTWLRHNFQLVKGLPYVLLHVDGIIKKLPLEKHRIAFERTEETIF